VRSGERGGQVLYLWGFKLRRVLIRRRRFGTTYRSHLHGTILGFLNPLRNDRWVIPKRRHEIITTLRSIPDEHICIMAEA
jgi:hypothetical protein